MMDVERIVRIALETGAEEVAARRVESRDKQVRFSRGGMDIVNTWQTVSTGVFIATDGRTTGVEIKRGEDPKEVLEKAVRFCRRLPENRDFVGLYPGGGGSREPDPFHLEDIFDAVKEAMDAGRREGVKRISGELYLSDEKVELATNYTTREERRSFLITTVRAFNEEGTTGQASTHVADEDSYKKWGPGFVGEKAAKLASMNRSVRQGEEGNYTVLFDPLCFGALLSEVSEALSAFLVDTGMSFFINLLGERVSTDGFTLYDDPLRPGGGARGFDDEGAPTRRNLLIEKGILKSYLHTHSTAKKFSTSTTANASGGRIMSTLLPEGWQPFLAPGRRSWEDILGDIKRGLYIANTWYTRYQDLRAGDFSTIPRDGIFLIEDGEIKEAWGGVRISENMLKLLKNVKEVSSEALPSHWWGEARRAYSPHVLVDNVKITKAR